MPKKKKGGNKDAGATREATAPAPSPASGSVEQALGSGDVMPLIICRNKHWRYISSFHGPWLHLPLEGLQSLAHSNYNSPRPRPIEPGVFFDLVKIRRLVGEATPLTVAAANGYGPGKMKLSHERKHRMRDQATKRLSQAYRIDEIATSVAIMQGTTSLETVAEQVLEKKPTDADAKYVHFFHEKIPSRRVVESTPLGPLNNIIAARPMDPEPLRTRAVLRIFAEDFEGAVADLTSAIQVVRFNRPAHMTNNDPKNDEVVVQSPIPGRRPPDVRLSEEEQPSSLELQLVFQRAGAYLSRACQYIYAALPPPEVHENRLKALEAQLDGQVKPLDGSTFHLQPKPELTPAEREAGKRQLEARKFMRTNAKRALRDYMSFLDHIEYSPNFPLEDPEESRRSGRQGSRQREAGSNEGCAEPSPLPTHTVYKVSALFESTPPQDLPPYPPLQTSGEQQQQWNAEQGQSPVQVFQYPGVIPVEYTTYHPLVVDALHAILLCHSLLQTSSKELQRHSFMVARLTRLADGYPIFQASRSPARADWMEVIRRVGEPDWLSLGYAWDALCKPPHMSIGHAEANNPVDQPHWQDLALSTLPTIIPISNNDRDNDPSSSSPPPSMAATQSPRSTPISGVSPQASASKPGEGLGSELQTATNARGLSNAPAPASLSPSAIIHTILHGGDSGGGGTERRNWSWNRNWNPADDDGREYPIVTERATAIARWVRESPFLLPPSSSGTSATKKKKKPDTQQQLPPGMILVTGIGSSSAATTSTAAAPTTNTTDA